MTTRFLKTLKGEAVDRPPFWVMRQAGRYLPEYLKVREQAGSFLTLCYTPELASEVTLQPIRRFDMDAAIIFSDILIIPQALGVPLDFVKGEGPKLDTLRSTADITQLNTDPSALLEFLNPVFEAVSLTREQLAADKSLIGFAGAPWTLSLYMLDNHPSKDCPTTRSWAWGQPQAFETLLNVLTSAVITYLDKKIEAGADAVQLFESWASHVPAELFEMCVQKPIFTIARALKEKHPATPLIFFGRGLKPYQLEVMAKCPHIDALGIDHGQDIQNLSYLKDHVTLQGNLDPAILLTDPATVRQKTTELLDKMAPGGRFMFNLGHGILPPTPVENMQAMAETIKNYSVKNHKVA